MLQDTDLAPAPKNGLFEQLLLGVIEHDRQCCFPAFQPGRPGAWNPLILPTFHTATCSLFLFC